MISLYGGRLLLFCDRLSRTWHVRVVLGPRPEHTMQADTGAAVLRDARAQAQLIFHDAVRKIRPPCEPAMCWDCQQWEMRRNRCALDLPEARQSGGRYAARCAWFTPATQ